jgi:hypothetical protein
MKKAELNKILRQQLPGYEVVEQLAPAADPDGGGSRVVPGPRATYAPSGVSPRADRVDALRKRFLGADAPVSPKRADAAAEPETTTVLVKPIGKDAPAKAVIIEKGRIVARQG